MPIEIIRNDITTMKVDAIVNAANTSLLGGGGVDGMIHRAAGPSLLAECRLLGGCATGDAKITGAYRLPCRYVIHTVGPVWQGGHAGEEAALRSCYARSLALAVRHQCQSIAFPLISAGAYGYPRALALRIAMDEISRFLTDHDLTVYMVVFDKASFAISEFLYASISQYIDDRYADAHVRNRNQMGNAFPWQTLPPPCRSRFDTGSHEPIVYNDAMREETACEPPLLSRFPEDDEPLVCGKQTAQPKAARPSPVRSKAKASLEDMLSELDESFSQSLLRLIDERGMKDSDCYKRANIDRKLFSKIRSNPQYQPTKRTAVALSIALELSLPETLALLAKAGFTLSHASKFDMIIEFFIVNEKYNIYEINEALFAFDQQLLGA